MQLINLRLLERGRYNLQINSGMCKLVAVYAIAVLLQCSAADGPAAPSLAKAAVAAAAAANGKASEDKKRAVMIGGGAPGHMVIVGDDGLPSVAVGDPDGVVMRQSRVLSMDAPLEPLVMPPVLDVYPEVPDRVGDVPLEVETLVESDDEQELDVPWIWDDKVCSALLDRPAPPAGPLTSDQVTFKLPLVIRDGKKLRLATNAGVISGIHSEEAAETFEKLFWCITALIARVRDPDERSMLMKKLYEDYLLWMERDVIPVWHSSDLQKAYKWIKKKDDSKWVVPEKRWYDSAQYTAIRRRHRDNTLLIIAILIFILLVILICYCCIVKRRKIFNFWCFCVCERCKKKKTCNNPCEEERKPLTVRKGGCCGRMVAVGPDKSYVYRSSSWSSNSSVQPPCVPDHCRKYRHPPCP